MSWFENEELPCPSCGQMFLGATAETINVTRMPGARDKILDGSFNRVRCPHCQVVSSVDRPFLYSDMKRQHFVHVFPITRAGDWPEWEEAAARVFAEAFGNAPPAMQEFAKGFQVRAVFGLPALADKLRLWDASLDDAIVELLKLELVTTTPELRTRRDLRVDVIGVDLPAGLIEVAAGGAPGTQPLLYGMRMARYHELCGHREELMENYMGLFTKPFVGYRRLAREVLAKALLPIDPEESPAEAHVSPATAAPAATEDRS